jgi:NAD(P)-dependent dehydrogenase (short-subunit alcohol dehydrogenase family)
MLKEKVVSITGAAGRLGSAIARGVIARDGRAVLVDIDRATLPKVLAGQPTSSCLRFIADAGVPEQVDQCIRDALSQFGRIDAAIHAAYPRSAGWGTRFEELRPEYLNQDLSRHLGGAILFSQRILEFFKKQGHGNLVHIASIMGVSNPKFEVYADTHMTSPIEYSAIKSGVISVTRYLARYYRGSGIRVNCISPGGILDGQPIAFLEKYRALCNRKGMLDADDIVETALYLLSDGSTNVTGQNIVVDDGWSL